MTLPYGAEHALERFKEVDQPAAAETTEPPRGRWPRGAFPLLMLVLTALSTIWVGVAAWAPDTVLSTAVQDGSMHIFRRCVLANWKTGLIFSASLLAILMAHELGHYFMMRWYGIRSSFPIFIPFPISPFGTCGALIVMDPSRADRKQIFDIGIAGPLAGLLVAIPLAILGLIQPQGPPLPQSSGLKIGEPLIMYLLDRFIGNDAIMNTTGINTGTSSPLFMAAWIGFFITGLNMVPISQLDGGHVAFGIFGRFSDWIAKGAFLLAIVFLISSKTYGLSLMLLLVYMMGLSHPPSSDDTQRIGITRTIIGLASMCLPILCVAATPIHF
ncbi:MAG: site-2 protease family protein [Pirellulaceae bacterium]|nr:site-2 protease family protein [Pirellulaceae bacterium]